MKFKKKIKKRVIDMQKNIGKSLALYPTPLVVVGTMVNNAPNYVLVGHLGIMGYTHIMFSLIQ